MKCYTVTLAPYRPVKPRPPVPIQLPSSPSASPHHVRAPTLAEVHEGFSEHVLHAVESGHAALSIWHDALPSAVATAAESLRHGAACSHRLRIPTHPSELPLSDFLRPFGYEDVQHQPLADFIAQLLHIANAVIGSRPLWLRLDRIADDGCRRFHVDYVQVRMLCTLVGPGTEWLAEFAVDRARLRDGSQSQVRDASAVRSIPSGAVALLRGERHPLGSGVVHRSPPLGGAAPRLLAVIES